MSAGCWLQGPQADEAAGEPAATAASNADTQKSKETAAGFTKPSIAEVSGYGAPIGLQAFNVPAMAS